MHFSDIKECDDPNRCPANSDCRELEGSYTCVCRSGFRGDGTTDCVDIDECVENPEVCDMNALCTNTPGNYTCECNAGYSGTGATCAGKIFSSSKLKGIQGHVLTCRIKQISQNLAEAINTLIF